MYGFVYEWHDKLTNMKYVGSHHGHVNDQYIGSGKWFKQAYKKRPTDFSRIILCVNDQVDDVKFTQFLEQQELNKIHPEDFGRTYYNLKPFACGGGQMGRAVSEQTRLKIGNSIRANTKRGQKISQSQTGKTKSESARKRMSEAKIGKPLEHKRKTYLLQNEDGSQTVIIGLQIWLKQNGISWSTLYRHSLKNEFWCGWKIITVEGVPYGSSRKS